MKTVVIEGETENYEVIDEAIHGGIVIIRRVVGSMYQYRAERERKKAEQALVDEAARLYPWSRNPKVTAGRKGYMQTIEIRLKAPDHVRAKLIQEAIAKAEKKTCACGCCGNWDEAVTGTAGGYAVTWAGCDYCSGSAVGRPIRTSDLEWLARRKK